MIKISIKLDKRRRLNNGKFPLKIKIARKNSALYIATGYELHANEWDSKNEKVKLLTNRNAINLKLSKRIVEITDKVQELQNTGKLRLIPNKKLLAILTNQDDSNDIKEHLFKTQCEKFIKTKENQGTISIYNTTINIIRKYCNYDDLLLEDIDVEWIDNFVRHLKHQGNKENTIATRLRCIRAVISFAKRRGKTDYDAFLNYSIKIEETVKRSLTVEQLRACNYSAIALHLNPRLKYTAKRPIKRQNKVSIFLAYVRYFLYLYTYERASCGHIKSTARYDSRDKVDA